MMENGNEQNSIENTLSVILVIFLKNTSNLVGKWKGLATGLLWHSDISECHNNYLDRNLINKY